jgi:hypothetical protein
MSGYVIAYLFGCATVGAVWYFWPTEMAWLQRELDRAKAELARLKAKLP